MSDWDTPLTFTAVSANSTVELVIEAGSPTVSGLQYRTSTEGAWETYPIGTEDAEITLANVGDYVQFQNKEEALSSDSSNYVKFTLSGSVAASGNVQALLKYSQSCTSGCFSNLFRGCAALTQAPEFPSLQLATRCYAGTFYGCTSLTSAPELPALTIGYMSYAQMFRGCTALASIPDIPASSVATYGCVEMFYGCSALVTPPALSATSLSAYCYNAMFHSCPALTTAPALPATTLATYCYYNMFQGCTSLTRSPILPATTLVEGCYRMMFTGCSNLSDVRVSFTEWPSSNATENWLNNVAASGNFYKPNDLPETRGASNIPTNWTLKSEYKPLTLTAVTAGAKVTLNKTGSPTVSGLQYRRSVNDSWTPYTIGTEITLTNVGDHVQLENTSTYLSSSDDYVQFSMTGSVAASGSIQALLGYNESCRPHCFRSLFYGCGSLTTAPELPSLTLDQYCYRLTFRNCTALTVPPQLPATTMTQGCYSNMFNGCTSLTSAPILAATTLANGCYDSMFYGCTSLTTTPALPATTLAETCYLSMFRGCTALTTVSTISATSMASQSCMYMLSNCTALQNPPELLATSLSRYCYANMFEGDSNLLTAPALPATVLAVNCYNSMFRGCVRLQEAPELPAEELSGGCYGHMFNGCTALSSIKVSFTAWLDGATADWVSGVSSTGNFYKPNALSDVRGINNIPTNWTLKSEYKPLTFTAKEANSTVKITKTGSPTVSGLRYRTSISSDWTGYTIDDVITLANVDDYVQFENTEGTLSTSDSNYASFALSGKVEATGNIQALLSYSTACNDYCYWFLFYNNSALLTAPEFPALVLGRYCYGRTLSLCTALKVAPDLPSTELQNYCYTGMFRGCTGLIKAPGLPATTLAQYCYINMFNGCTSLVEAPHLPATTSSYRCYYEMFHNCSALQYISLALNSWPSNDTMTDWVTGVSSTGTFYKKLKLPEEYGVTRIPQGWNVINVDAIECSPGLPTLMDPFGGSAPYIRKLSYLESTGTQYIILQHPVSRDTRISVDFQGAGAVQADVSPVFGAESHSTDPRWWGGKGSKQSFNIILTSGSLAQPLLTLNEETYNGQRHTIGFDGATGFVDEERYTFPAAEISYSSIMLFGCLDRGVPSFVGKLRIYSFELDGEEYIPVIDPAGVPAFYGTSSHTFWYNQGTGIFNYG